MAGATNTTIIIAESNPVVVQTQTDGETTYEASTQAHGGVKESIFPPFDSSTYGAQLFWLAITFGALYIIMSKVALPRIGEILEVRRDRIEGDLAEAERLRQKTDQAIESYEAELAQSKAKAHEIAEETRNKIKDELASKRSEVEADLAKKLTNAESRIQKTKTEALSNVGEIATDTVIDLVSKLSSKINKKAASDAVAKIVAKTVKG